MATFTENGSPVSEDWFWEYHGRPCTSDARVTIGFDWSVDPPRLLNASRLRDEGAPLERPAWEELVAAVRLNRA